MTTIKHLFLDLEDTIIAPVVNGWPNTSLVNVPKIRGIIEKYQPDQVHLFSFAIWNEYELKSFNIWTREKIERALGVKIELTPTVDNQIIPACCDIMRISRDTVDFSEASAFWGKHEAFRLFVRHKFARQWIDWQIDTHVMLLDDMVINENFEWPNLHITGHIVNIDHP